MPRDATQAPTVNCAIVYNPLDTNDRTIAPLEWAHGRTLADYLDGLPDGLHWGVCLNAEPVEPEHWASTIPAPGDWITIVPIPEGGGGGKTVLRMVAMIGVVVAAAYFGPIIAAEIPGAMAAGPMLNGTAGYMTTFGSIASAVTTGAIPATGGMVVIASFPVGVAA